MSGTGEPANWPVGFRRHLQVEVIAGEATYLFADNQVTVLHGPQIAALAPLLDGSRTIPALLRDPPESLTPHQVGALVRDLAEAGLVGLRAPSDDDVDEAALVYWAAAGLDATGPGDGRVRLLRLGDVDVSTVESALRGAALTVAPDGYPADLAVVLCEDYLEPRLADVDAEHRAAGLPWLLAKPGGTQPWIGPVFQPVGGGCWHCLADRLRRHRPVRSTLTRNRPAIGQVPRPVAAIGPLTSGIGQLVALEATKWLAGYRYPGQAAVWTLDSLTMATRHHELRARPQCASCGNPTMMRELARRPVELRPRTKVDTASGGHRAQPPEQILDRYRHLISPVTGVIKEIRRDPRGPAFFNVFRSGPNLAASHSELAELRSTLRAQSGGKGITALHAEVGALCEAVERYSGTFHGDEERVAGSLRSLGEQAIHPNACQLYHDRQYRDRAAWNSAHGPFQRVPEPFDEQAVIDWTPVWSLTEKRHRLLPTTLLYYNMPDGHLRADSNGNAAGGSLEDAVLQGMLELVERDAVALWWYNRTRMPGVDLDAFADPWIGELREVHATLERDVWVLDVTSDLRIPAMVALSRRTGGPPEQIMLGFGAHLDPRIALRRALCELNQMMPAVLGDEIDQHDSDLAAWWREATVHNQPYLMPDPARHPSRPTDFVYRPQPDVTTDVRAIQHQLEAIGLEVLVLDQTRPDIDLPVVKVIVPGLRHFWARYAPGRLYDVPVTLGLLSEPTPYEMLNPIPMFL